MDSKMTLRVSRKKFMMDLRRKEGKERGYIKRNIMGQQSELK